MNPAQKFLIFAAVSLLCVSLFNPIFAASLPLKLTAIGNLAIPAEYQEASVTWYYTGRQPQFTGTTEGGAEVCITIESPEIEGCTTADSGGSWAWTPPSEIPDGDHQVTITASDNGNQGSLSFTLGINTGEAQTGSPLYQAVILIALSLFTLYFAVRTFKRRWEPTL